MRTRPDRFHTLDGMRGVAAVLVAAYHFIQRVQGESFAGYLAVDLFFVLSGFVIALSYSDKLSVGLTAGKFAEMRVVRLFPLYMAGLMLGLAKNLLGYVINDPRAMSIGLIVCHVAFGVTMLPSLCSPELFPLNGPSWSLFFEVVVNVLFGLILWRTRTATLAAVMAIAAVYLAATIGAPDYFNVGWGWHNFVEGAARTAFSFTAGILLYRHFPCQERRASWLALLPILAMVGFMLIDAPSDLKPLVQLLIVTVGFPALVMLGIRFEAPRLLAPVFGILGDLSYPLYAIHWPLIAIAVPLLAMLQVPPTAAALIFVLGLMPAAYLASLTDARVRAWISGKLKLRRTAMPQVV